MNEDGSTKVPPRMENIQINVWDRNVVSTIRVTEETLATDVCLMLKRKMFDQSFRDEDPNENASGRRAPSASFYSLVLVYHWCCASGGINAQRGGCGNEVRYTLKTLCPGDRLLEVSRRVRQKQQKKGREVLGLDRFSQYSDENSNELLERPAEGEFGDRVLWYYKDCRSAPLDIVLDGYCSGDSSSDDEESIPLNNFYAMQGQPENQESAQGAAAVASLLLGSTSAHASYALQCFPQAGLPWHGGLGGAAGATNGIFNGTPLRRGFLLRRSRRDPNLWRRRWAVLSSRLWTFNVSKPVPTVLAIPLDSGDITVTAAPPPALLPAGRASSSSSSGSDSSSSSSSSVVSVDNGILLSSSYDGRPLHSFRAPNAALQLKWTADLESFISYESDSRALGMAELMIADEEAARASRAQDPVIRALQQERFVKLLLTPTSDLMLSAAVSPFSGHSHRRQPSWWQRERTRTILHEMSNTNMSYSSGLSSGIRGDFRGCGVRSSECGLDTQAGNLPAVLSFLVGTQLYREVQRLDLSVSSRERWTTAVLVFEAHLWPVLQVLRQSIGGMRPSRVGDVIYGKCGDSEDDDDNDKALGSNHNGFCPDGGYVDILVRLPCPMWPPEKLELERIAHHILSQFRREEPDKNEVEGSSRSHRNSSVGSMGRERRSSTNIRESEVDCTDDNAPVAPLPQRSTWFWNFTSAASASASANANTNASHSKVDDAADISTSSELSVVCPSGAKYVAVGSPNRPELELETPLPSPSLFDALAARYENWLSSSGIEA
jgi:hypothetical protein